MFWLRNKKIFFLYALLTKDLIMLYGTETKRLHFINPQVEDKMLQNKHNFIQTKMWYFIFYFLLDMKQFIVSMILVVVYLAVCSCHRPTPRLQTKIRKFICEEIASIKEENGKIYMH